MKTTLRLTFIALYLAVTSSADTWESIGPDGGHFIGAITDPDNSQVITAVTSHHTPTAVYHSTDGGKTWARKGMVPGESKHSRFYAFDVSRLYILYFHDRMCYFTKDGGSTWDSSTFPSTVSSVSCLYPHPTNPDIVFAAGSTNWGMDSAVLLKSMDGGKSWISLKTGILFDPSCLAVAPSNPDIIFMGGYDMTMYLFSVAMAKSSDGGQTWSNISGQVDPEPVSGLYRIAIDPLDEKRVYTGSLGRFYRTADGGVTWTHNDVGSCIVIGVDPVNPANIYRGGHNHLYLSNDYGQTWTEHPDFFEGSMIHIHVAPAAPSKVYISSMYGGLLRSENWGGTWNWAHQGIRALPVPSLAVAPSRPETIFMGGLRNSTLMASHDSGKQWQEMSFPEGGYINNTVNDVLVSSMNADAVMLQVAYG